MIQRGGGGAKVLSPAVYENIAPGESPAEAQAQAEAQAKIPLKESLYKCS